jgi:hypothetical protein
MTITDQGNVGIGTTDPSKTLDVNGSVSVASLQVNQRTASTGTEDLYIVRGNVTIDPSNTVNGVNTQGAGFSIEKSISVSQGHAYFPLSAGTFDIVFNPPFSDYPTVVVTQVNPGGNNFDPGDTTDYGSTKATAIVVKVNNDRVRIKTGDSDGTGANRDFAFIAIGPR